MLGACVDPVAAEAPCERGRARNLDDGTCTTTRDTRELARAAGVYADDGDVIECEGKLDELVASGRLGRIGCVARQPAPPPPCPARAVRTPGSGDCSPLDRAGSVDIASWSRAAAAEICARLLRSPVALASPGTETTIAVDLELSAPNNDLALAFVRVRTRPPVADADLARARAPVDNALRRLGDPTHPPASASDVSAAAICRTSSRRPISVP
jgi:hypothetical protein